MSIRRLERREFLTVAALSAIASTRRSGFAAPTPTVEDGIAWYDVRRWGVEGKGWTETARYFDRLPAKAEDTVRPAVWNLSRHSAGLLVRFRTNAAAVHARYSLSSPRLALPHMPATGVSGLDLYARDQSRQDRWLAVAFPNAQHVNVRLAGEIDVTASSELRLYTAYLPLYNGVESLEFGVPAGAEFRGVAPRTTKPIVFYGTSIMHGACASRPGMSITGILGRRLNRPVINLGFSGNGRMEAEVGALLAELDPAVYVIDCLPNMQADAVAQRAAPLMRQLSAARPDTPILLVEDRTYGYAPFRRPARNRHASSRAALRDAVNRLAAAGVKNLHYLTGEQLLGSDGEATTDGSHPNDLGMIRYADAYEPVLRSLVGARSDQSQEAVRVSGIVVYDGNPLKGAEVSFLANSRRTTRCDQSGHFLVMIPPGDYTVTISLKRSVFQELLPARYSEPANSVLRFTVPTGGTSEANFTNMTSR